MGLLMLMGGVSDPNPQSLFVNNELGLAIDIGDRNGASEAKRTWRRNLLTYSEQFDNAAWTKLQSSVTANSATAPDGTTTADSLIEDSSTNTHLVLQIPSGVSANTVFTMSVYVKPNGRNWIRLVENNGSGIAAYFDIQNGALGTVLGGTTAISSVGNGWYRCSIRGTTGAAQTSINFNIRLANANGGESYTGNGTSGVFIWGAQVELGTSTDYQPITDFNTEFKAAYPNHSLYVDSNGVAPAVYPGDQVGLVIDSSRGGLENLGAEKWVHASVDVNSTESQILGNQSYRIYSSAGSNSMVRVLGATTVGKWYRVEFTINSIAVAGSGVRIADTGAIFTTTGTKVSYWLADATQAFIKRNVAACDYTISNVSFKEIPGNHAYQTTSGSRPALARTPDGGRRNLLTYSEDLSNAIWGKTSVTVTGTDTIVLSAGSAGKFVFQTITGTAPSTISFEAKEGTHRYIQVVSSSDSQHFVNIDLQTGTIGTTGSKAEGALIESLSGGWNKYRVTITNTGFSSIRFYAVDSSSAAYGASTSATTSWQMRKVQLETGSSATTYQKVTTTHDVTEASRRDCWGLMADGSDDSLITTSVDFSGTDKMTVMAGVRKNSDANRGMIVELSANAELNAGTFLLSGPDFTPGTNKYAIYGRASGSILSLMDTAAGRTAPVTNVLSMTNDLSLSNAEHSLRINGALVGSTSGDSGSGNFGNYALFIGRRNNTDTPFAGIIYTLIIRGAATPTSTIADFEKNLLRLRAGLGPF